MPSAIMPLLLLPCLALAADGPGWLAQADQAAAPAQDAHVVMEIAIEDEHGKHASRTMEVWQKGEQLRLVRLNAPARLAGVGLLVGADDQMHLYLPSYGRVRRVIGQQRGDAFLGTDISMEDLARTSFSDEYEAQLEEEGAEQVLLRLTPRSAEDHKHASSRLWLRTQDQLWTRLEHLDEDGQVLQRVSLSDFRSVEGRLFAHRMLVEDVERGRRTQAQATHVVFDQGLDDELFTVSNLSRP